MAYLQDGEVVRVRAKKDGETVKVSAGDQFTKICHDELVEFMTAEGEALTFADKGPTGIMMVGLQGSGEGEKRVVVQLDTDTEVAETPASGCVQTRRQTGQHDRRFAAAGGADERRQAVPPDRLG